VDQEKIRISIDWDRGAQSSGAPCVVEPPESRKREILEVRAGCGKEMAGAMQFVPDPAHDAPADAVHTDIVRIFFNSYVSPMLQTRMPTTIRRTSQIHNRSRALTENL
jgi:hypothetical protein